MPRIPEPLRRRVRPALLTLFAAAWAGMGGGCSYMPGPDYPGGDGPPSRTPDLSHIPDAVPRIEPRSRGGNPDSYRVFGRRYRVMDSSAGFVERGTASWYGRKFHGRKTSNGETYDMYGMTAAHKHLPLPTYVRVTNLDNGRNAVVRVNDRGPFHGGRIIDLSYAAAYRLGLLAKGTAPVEIRAIDPRRPGSIRVAETEPPAAPPPRPAASPVRPAAPSATTAPTEAVGSGPRLLAVSAPIVFLQAGAFSSEHNARQLQARLSRELEPEVRVAPAQLSAGPVYRVQIGPLSSVQHADLLAAELKRLGLGNTRVVVD